MRAQKFYILSWGAMLLLFIVLLNTLVKLYWEKEAVLVQNLSNNFESLLRRYKDQRIFGVKRNQNRLVMHHAIAVGKELCLGLIWGMFIVFFQISAVIIYEYPDISAFKFFAALYPYDLSAMITWLHTITANVYPELGTSRNATGRHLYLLEHFTLKKSS